VLLTVACRSYNNSMQIVFVDDSVGYDGYSPSRRPLGGVEKAVVGLATALADRTHDVKVLNNVGYAHMAMGAYYMPRDSAGLPRTADVVIAVRKPALLGAVRNAKHRLLWVPGAPDYLSSPANEPLWDSFEPTFIFVNPMQQRAYTGKIRNMLLTPGTRTVFQTTEYVPATEPYASPSHQAFFDSNEPKSEVPPETAAPEPVAPKIPPPHAVVTTHPSHGLANLIDLWTGQIHAQLPEARLSIYSIVLNKGLKGEAIPPEIMPVLEKVKAAASANVVVVEPRGDDGMAEAYRESRVHLYPGHPQDFACWTLQESQAAGLPAVARALGGVHGCIDNGQSGYIVPDDAALANVALEILRNDAVYKNLSEGALAPARQRSWDVAAAELETFITSLG